MALNDPTTTLAAFSADSHVTEPPHTYTARIDPKYRETAPRVIRDDDGGDCFIFDGMPGKVPLGIIAAAGIPPEKMRLSGVPFEELHKGGWDGKARVADQDKDGVIGEIIYPIMAGCPRNSAPPPPIACSASARPRSARSPKRSRISRR